MYSLSFLIVELETARTTLLDVFEVSTGVPKWNCHGAISGSAVRAELASHLGAFQHGHAFAKRIEPRPRRRRLCEARDAETEATTTDRSVTPTSPAARPR